MLALNWALQLCVALPEADPQVITLKLLESSGICVGLRSRGSFLGWCGCCSGGGGGGGGLGRWWWSSSWWRRSLRWGIGLMLNVWCWCVPLSQEEIVLRTYEGVRMLIHPPFALHSWRRRSGSQPVPSGQVWHSCDHPPPASGDGSHEKPSTPPLVVWLTIRSPHVVG